ncbi:MAG: hypothetical protein KGI97_01080 [Alphaproteobacteria bacterium]|nr:hypothetical protein [Alphaproteobacteria bacterium]
MDELSLTDYLAIFRRHRKYFLTAFFALWGVSILFALSWSDYRSTATVEVEQPQIAPAMTAPVGDNGQVSAPESLADLRISRIEQKVTSPASLISIIGKFHLYPHAHGREPAEALARRMAHSIKLTLIGGDIVNPAATQRMSADQLSAIAFTLSFDYSDPQTAQLVLNELITRFLAEDLKSRRADAETTSAFLGAQIAQLGTSLAAQEKEIAAFQSKNGVVDPATLLFNQQASANAAISLQSLDSQIAANEGTQGSLRAQLADVDPYTRVLADGQILTTPETQLRALEAQYATLTAQYGPDHPDVVRARNQIAALRRQVGADTGPDTAALRAQIKNVETNLAAARKSEGPKNPDRISLERQLGSLKKQLVAARRDSSSSGIRRDADNPAYLALAAQLRAAEQQHKSLAAQRRALVAQQKKYEKAVLQNPDLQQQMDKLSRDHKDAEKRYADLKERKMAADMEAQMIKDHKGQRLVVSSPPDLPLTTHPRRILLFIGGFLFSLLGGAAAVALAYAVDQSVSGAAQLEAVTGTAPLAVVPYLATGEEKKRAGQWPPEGWAMVREAIGDRIFAFRAAGKEDA